MNKTLKSSLEYTTALKLVLMDLKGRQMSKILAIAIAGA